MNLPLRLAVEFDAIYRRLGYEYQQSGPLTIEHTVANSREFPLLGKFALLPGPVAPFVDAGASFHYISGISQIRETYLPENSKFIPRKAGRMRNAKYPYFTQP